MNIREYSANSLSFLGDAVYTLAVREHFLNMGHQVAKDLQRCCNRYNSASGQKAVFDYLSSKNFFSSEELDVFKRGRNHITHVPKNGDLATYGVASGLEAIVGFLYLTDKERLSCFFDEILRGSFSFE